MNLFSLMPADIRESATRLNPKFDGPWHETWESGTTVEWWTDGNWSGDEQTRFVTWDELGTTSDFYYDYAHIANKPSHPPWRYSGSIFRAPWGDSPKQFDLPSVHACCAIWTESGYVSLFDPTPIGYVPWSHGLEKVNFSSDGDMWEFLGPIAGEDTWVARILAVNSGVIASNQPQRRPRTAGTHRRPPRHRIAINDRTRVKRRQQRSRLA